MYDIFVVGGGPAGLTAALYGLRGGKSVAIAEKGTFGGQIANSPKVENIPGFASVSGDEFGDLYLDQVIGQGAEVIFDEVTGISKEGDIFSISLACDAPRQAKAVILATGTKHRVLGLPGEEELIGAGVHFCAVCDGDFYRGRNVVIIGGGNSAFVEANLLVEIAGSLTLLQDLPVFTADAKLQEQLFAHDNIEKHVSTKILSYETEDGKLTAVRYEEGGQEKLAPCDGVFLAIGLIPDGMAFAGLAETDAPGYFVADERCLTKTAGVFVAGDCRTKEVRQVTTACADGANAAIAAINFLRG